MCLIVTACKLVENGRSKCERFFPTGDEGDSKHLKDKDIKVVLSSEEQLSPNLILRKFSVTDEFTKTN